MFAETLIPNPIYSPVNSIARGQVPSGDRCLDPQCCDVSRILLTRKAEDSQEHPDLVLLNNASMTESIRKNLPADVLNRRSCASRKSDASRPALVINAPGWVGSNGSPVHMV